MKKIKVLAGRFEVNYLGTRVHPKSDAFYIYRNDKVVGIAPRDAIIKIEEH